MELSSRYNLLVVLPSGENSFYTEGSASGRRYQTFVGEELLRYVRQTFHVSTLKEDTFIGGFSMGGFGALLTGLTFPETYQKIFLFSAALITGEVANVNDSRKQLANTDYFRLVFGELSDVTDSLNHPPTLLNKLQETKTEIPDLFVACGTEDGLIEHSREFVALLNSQSIPVTYYEEAGGHDFQFWNKLIEPAIQWCLEE